MSSASRSTRSSLAPPDMSRKNQDQGRALGQSQTVPGDEIRIGRTGQQRRSNIGDIGDPALNSKVEFHARIEDGGQPAQLRFQVPGVGFQRQGSDTFTTELAAVLASTGA